MELRCAICSAQACCEEPDSKPYPRFCPMAPENERQALAEARAAYENRETRELSITAVHPMREEAVAAFLARAGAGWTVVQRLIAQGELVETEYEEHKFYTRRPLPSSAN